MTGRAADASGLARNVWLEGKLFTKKGKLALELKGRSLVASVIKLEDSVPFILVAVTSILLMF